MIIAIVIGAALGAATSAATGGDIGKGALTGAIGGIFGGLGGALGGAIGGQVGALAGAVAGGATGGAVSAAVTGGDVGMGALTGAIAGGIGWGVGWANANYLDDALSEFSVATISGSLGGGIGAELQGGDFWQGVQYGAMGGAIGYSLYATVKAPGWSNPGAALKRVLYGDSGLGQEPYDSQINDNKFGHANMMSQLLQAFGPLAVPFLFLGGIGYEMYSTFFPGHVPGGPAGQRLPPFYGLFDGQNPVNWLWDTPGDILANGLGLMNGLLLSPPLTVEANKFGYLIPGPNYSANRLGNYPKLGGDARQLWPKLAPPGAAWPW
ncbi:MAG: hypothetical protein DME22_03075 [Verrucomicrobia bacterium]|nr:MAG: hypothetical protein DME22_03075 [Verrucomicrobiota bacterium]